MEEEVQEQKMGKISFEQFLKRVKNKQNVSKFEFEIDFRWNLELSKKLKEIGLSKANLSGADLRGADLRGADLSGAKGEFIFNFGVKLKVMNEKIVVEV